jgi:hypothetical protein
LEVSTDCGAQEVQVVRQRLRVQDMVLLLLKAVS